MKNGIAHVKKLARLDIEREKRTGIPEAIFCQGKEPQWVVKIIEKMLAETSRVIATRVDAGCGETLLGHFHKHDITYSAEGRILVVKKRGIAPLRRKGVVGLLAAGTCDIPVAEEARITMEALGVKVITAYDVGVAGIHRLVAPLERIVASQASCVVVAAGMEGALPTVVRGLIDKPVIGVPTSSGYGFGGRGEAALMTMLQTCSPGLVVVNIDNGFGAAVSATLIARQCADHCSLEANG